MCELIKTIVLLLMPPWWHAHEVRINKDREAALKAYKDQSQPLLQFFIDGSGFDNRIGTSAYSPILGEHWQPIRSVDTHTVYAAELEGINKALTIIGKQYGYKGAREVTIYTDNQAVIQACSAPQRSSGQYILRQIIQRIDFLYAANWRIKI
jgi:ribonuclease HI